MGLHCTRRKYAPYGTVHGAVQVGGGGVLVGVNAAVQLVSDVRVSVILEPVPPEAQSPPQVTVEPEFAVSVMGVPCTNRAEHVPLPLLQLIPVAGLDVTAPLPWTCTVNMGA